MKRRVPLLLLTLSALTAMLWGTGCLPEPVEMGQLRLLLTDKPFPFDYIAEANVTITKITIRKADETAEPEDGSDDDTDDQTSDDGLEPAQDTGSNGDGTDDSTDGDGTSGDTTDGDSDDSADDEDDDSDDDDSSFVTIFNDPEGKTFNLVELQNGKTDLLSDMQVPAGTYTQLRLVVSEGEVVLTDERTFDLTVPSGSTSGIKLNTTFEVASGGQTELLLDFDLSRAFKPIPGSGVNNIDDITSFHFSPSLSGALRLMETASVGKISGTVTDAETTAIASAAVTAYDSQGEEVTTTATAEDGTYVLSGLAAGTYTVEASATGYTDAEQTGVEVTAKTETSGVDFALEPATQATDSTDTTDGGTQ